MAKVRFRPGQLTLESGTYEAIGPGGGRTGIRRFSEMGNPFPPTPRPGQFWQPVASMASRK